MLYNGLVIIQFASVLIEPVVFVIIHEIIGSSVIAHTLILSSLARMYSSSAIVVLAVIFLSQ